MRWMRCRWSSRAGSSQRPSGRTVRPPDRSAAAALVSLLVLGPFGGGASAAEPGAASPPGEGAAPVCPTAAAPPEEASARFAIVLGSNVGTGSDQEKLRYADDDALAAYDLAVQLGHRAILLTDLDDDTRARVGTRYDFARPPTGRELKAALAETLAAGRQARTTGRAQVRLLVWISAHGGADGSLYFKDGRYSRFDLAADLFAATDREGVDVDFVLDSCWPRAVVGRGPDRGALERAHARARWQADLDRFPRIGVLLAQTEDGKALEWSRLASGIFSFLVRSALRGAADVDGDGRVTYTEVEAFAQRAIGGIRDPAARLKIRAFLPRDSQDRPIADWPGSGGRAVRVRLPAGEGMRIRISHPTTGILLETHKGVDTNVCSDVVLRLPVGPPSFEVVRLDAAGEIRGRHRLTAALDRDLGPADLVPDEQPVAARGEELREAALRTGLYRDPYDGRSYHDWMNVRRSVWDQVDTTALVEAAEARARRRTWGWAAIGGGAVAAIGGVLAYAVADAAHRDWTDAVDRGDDPEATRLEGRTRRFDVAATVGFGLAGALTATGVGILIWDRFGAGEAAPPRTALRIGIQPGGLTVSGRF